MGTVDRFWTRRLRWRLLGAWRWPAFAVFTVVDAFLLHKLGVVRHWNIAFALISASFGNIALLVGADLLVRLTARNRAAQGVPMAPTQVETTIDRTGVALLAVGAVGLLVSGLATQHLIVSETNATTANAKAVEAWVNHNASEEYRRNLETANTDKLADNYFRTCIADDERDRFLCLFVDTKRKPPEVVRDPSTEPNRPQRTGGP
ncbi:MAG TPA: hypothetical protein VJT75_10375 [Thermoleophilaceae bacterium]|nr:hypothetical protein [Thermoleophilaceae bacterium]